MALGAIIPGLITGGLGIIEGLFNQGDAAKARSGSLKKAKTIARNNESRVRVHNRGIDRAMDQLWAQRAAYQKKPVDVRTMMKDAEKAGFNPVTWLNSGAMSFYSTASRMDVARTGVEAATNKQVYQRAEPAVAPPAPSTGSVITGGISQGVQAWMSAQQQADQNEFQMQMLEKQIAANAALQTNEQNFRKSLFGAIPQATLTGGRSGRGASAAPPVLSSDYPTPPSLDRPQDPPNRAGNPAGSYLQTPIGPWFLPGPSGETIEDEMGEGPLSWLYGIGRAGASLTYSENWKTLRDRPRQPWDVTVPVPDLSAIPEKLQHLYTTVPNEDRYKVRYVTPQGRPTGKGAQ